MPQQKLITMPAQHQNKQPGIESLMSPFRSLKMQTIKEVKVKREEMY